MSAARNTYPSTSVASVSSAMQPGNARDVLNPAGDRGGTKSDSASVAPLAVRHQPPEPCDREVSRSVRRLALLRPNSSVGQSSGPVPRRSAVQLGLGASLGSCGGSSRASRLPGSARPTVDGTRPANDDDVSLASVCGSALVVVGAFLLALVVYCW